jgi:hypothetical protein
MAKRFTVELADDDWRELVALTREARKRGIGKKQTAAQFAETMKREVVLRGIYDLSVEFFGEEEQEQAAAPAPAEAPSQEAAS